MFIYWFYRLKKNALKETAWALMVFVCGVSSIPATPFSRVLGHCVVEEHLYVLLQRECF